MTHLTRRLPIARIALLILLGLGFAAPSAVADEHGGTWTKRYQTIKGSWSIVETEDGRFLELDSKFKTRNAPDLKLFLSRRAANDVTPQNAVQDSVLISRLRKSKGAQRYALPADLDLAQFDTLVLHCEQYTKLWGVSPLHP